MRKIPAMVSENTTHITAKAFAKGLKEHFSLNKTGSTTLDKRVEATIAQIENQG